ncbi:hypothetical protein ACOKFD_10500 [Flagellimonas sp. S174]|uniref:hypothetical protein n=1 Tax=Flagellimonas sp. S174 TaxID=3410790 RepID=UPI003BF49400
MEEKISLPYKQKSKTKNVKWTFNRSRAAKATLIAMICFFIVLSLQNGSLFLDKILLCSGIIVALLVASAVKKS